MPKFAKSKSSPIDQDSQDESLENEESSEKDVPDERVKMPIKAKPKAVAEKQKGLAVSSAFLHQALTWPGTKGTAEKSINDQRIRGIKMFLIPQGLLIESAGKQCLVPHANVANYILAERIEIDA